MDLKGSCASGTRWGEVGDSETPLVQESIQNDGLAFDVGVFHGTGERVFRKVKEGDQDPNVASMIVVGAE
jgi:hypothetical protein